MPTKTFLRLPAEKQARLLDAAWAEFTRVSYADTSINNIVKDAGISRGSFYQYFADKDDLFVYLLKDIIDQLTEAYHHLLDQVHGDPFQLQLVSYDQFVQKSGEKQPLMDRFIRVVRINPGLDMQKLAEVEPGCMVLDTLAEYLDISGFRQQDPVFVHHVFSFWSRLSAPPSWTVSCGRRTMRRTGRRCNTAWISFSTGSWICPPR